MFNTRPTHTHTSLFLTAALKLCMDIGHVCKTLSCAMHETCFWIDPFLAIWISDMMFNTLSEVLPSLTTGHHMTCINSVG